MKLTRLAIDLLNIREDLQIRTNGEFTGDAAEIWDFDQMWGSTALGFSGMGGQAMTTARTYVVMPDYNSPVYVYFGGLFAYAVDEINDKFKNDLRNHRMASVLESGRYKKGINSGSK